MIESRKSTTSISYFSIIAMAALLVACAATTPVSRSPEEVVRQRAQERIDAFVKGDMEGSYRLTVPSYRKLHDLDAYKRSFGGTVRWEKAEVKTVTCEPERCKVAIDASVRPLVPIKISGSIAVQFEEPWLLEDGNWYLYQGS